MELLERDNELAALRGLVELARAGRGAAVLVAAEAGGGKTALLRQLVEDCAGEAVALTAGCEDLHTARPLGPFVDLAAALPQAVAERLTGGQHDAELFPAVLAQLAATEPPTLLIIEDLHWADDATLDLFRYLGRRAPGAGVVIIGSYRTEALPTTPALQELLGNLPEARRITLAPLSRQAVERLGGDRAAAGTLHATTGGNPFFVTEVLAAADTDGVPPTVRDAVLARTTRLGDAAREVVEWVSLEPGSMDIALLERAGPSLAALDECVVAGVLEVDPPKIAFRHELARQAVVQSQTATARLRMHRQLYAALEGTGDATLARLVHHAAKGGLTDELCRVGPRAAQAAAAAGAFAQAALLIETVLEAGSSLTLAARGLLLEHLTDAYAMLGRRAEGRTAANRALEVYRQLADRAGEARALVGAAYFGQGDGEALQLAAAARALLESLPPSRELVLADVICAMNLLRHDEAAARAAAARAVSCAEALDDPMALAHALDALAAAEMCISYGATARSVCQRALAHALAVDSAIDAASVYMTLVSGALAARDFVAVLADAGAALDYLLARDMDSWVATILACRAHARLASGHWADARADLRAFERYRQHPLRLARGRETAPPSAPGQGYGEVLSAVLAMRTGKPDPQQWIPLVDAPSQMPRWALVCFAAEAFWLAGDDRRAIEMIDAELRSARVPDGWPRAELLTWRARAGAPATLFDTSIPDAAAAEVAGDWQAAARAWAQLGCPYEQALALLAGDADAAESARTILERLGAGGAAAIARARLAELAGGTRRGPYRAAVTDPLGLTRRQRQVFELLRNGDSNQEIAAQMHRSVRTVEKHVAAIFDKLAVGSRRELWQRNFED